MPPATDTPTCRPARVHVDRIGTEPMSGQQRQEAAAALAALIDTWQHARKAAGAERGGGLQDAASPARHPEQH